MKKLLLASFLLLAACAADPGLATSDVVAAHETHPIHVFTSDASAFDTHSFWLDTGREVVVFDAQFTPKVAGDLVADIRRQTSSPIRWVVVTHPNPDKFNGAPVFQALGAKVVASESTARAIPGVHAYKKAYFVDVAKSFTAETYPAEAHVDVTFRGDYQLPLEGGASVKLHELANAGVSSTQTIAVLPDALVVGDLVHHEAHAWLEGGIVDGKPAPDLESWKRALDELTAYRGFTVYGGRGAAAKVEVAVPSQKAYLDRMLAVTFDFVREYGPTANEHAAELAKRAQTAFPSYALRYLIEYGAYGLVAKLQSK